MCSLSGATTHLTLHFLQCKEPGCPNTTQGSWRPTFIALHHNCSRCMRENRPYCIAFSAETVIGANTRETGLKKGRFALSITPAFPFPTSCGSCRVVVEAAFNETLSGDYVCTGIEQHSTTRHSTTRRVVAVLPTPIDRQQLLAAFLLLLAACCLLLSCCFFH